MRQDATIELFQYWNRLRAGRPAPKRTEIEPADIKKLLADTFILEKDTRGDAVFRLAGTRLCATYGRELKGYAFLSLWGEKDKALLGRLARGAFTTHSVVMIAFEGVTESGRATPFELLLLPLEGGREHPRLLGIVSAESRPFWLGHDPVVENRTRSVRVIDADREPVFLKNRPAVEMETPPLVPRNAENRGVTARRGDHLRVIEGGLSNA